MKRKKNSETVRVDAALCRRLARAAEWCDQGTSDAIAHYCPVTISTDPVENLELAEKISTEGLTRHYWLLKGAAYLTGRGPRFWNAANTTHAAEYHGTAHSTVRWDSETWVIAQVVAWAADWLLEVSR